MSCSLFFPIAFISYCLCLLEQLHQTRTFCHTMPWPAHSSSIHSCLHCCKIILYLPYILIFFSKLHLIFTVLKTQWELLMAWRCLRHSSQERWRTAPGASPPYTISYYYYSCHYNSVQALHSELEQDTSMVSACWLFTSTFPFLTDLSSFNSAMVAFNSLLSMITKGLKATWQLFTLTLQNQSTKSLYNIFYFCPIANFIKNTVAGNIQLFL